ncbi:hypothetical protein M569_17402 [Genlisea aurea]|uniref:Uncharacterized protein n=1 Tax=Genlisea aurea TaxID=192259 RepID=S8BZ45_9LAMI|nr:hypothetical protein M569_17402 [Genlisea aurea]
MVAMSEEHFVTFNKVPLTSVAMEYADGSPGANVSAGAVRIIQLGKAVEPQKFA